MSPYVTHAVQVIRISASPTVTSQDHNRRIDKGARLLWSMSQDRFVGMLLVYNRK